MLLQVFAIWDLFQLTYVFSSQNFPEMYAGGKAPAKLGAMDKERGSKTPPYMYGWVVSRVELYGR